ncbi:hypothetical protein D9758_008044 [Tetrapyrgos nigripes]|uniref:BTB domain-containing protein n=1 Tax=Tetrapyrgos nigripes TaxID=182062 RepID=A0A8H5D1G9_9AGAR|nr:hypothetical protein D9758_008044 [Tetrapyrgos nigripes]
MDSPFSLARNQVFDDSEADVILQSSDNVEFRTYKSLLSLASPMFHGMFALPAPHKSDSTDEMRDGLPVVQMAEESTTLEKLLMFCHPAHAPTLNTLDEIKGVLATAKKYGMVGAEERAARFLRQFVVNEPLRVYCIAWNFQLEEEARLAARRLLASPLLPRRHVKELNYVPAIALHRLEEYHYSCQRTAKTVALAYGWINKEALIRFDAGLLCYSCTNGGDMTPVCNGHSISARSWWIDYMKAAAVALQERPCGATVKDPELLNNVFRKAAHCTLCRESVFTEMTEFCEIFAREVDRATELVNLELEEA